jgi:hypothetical protein
MNPWMRMRTGHGRMESCSIVQGNRKRPIWMMKKCPFVMKRDAGLVSITDHFYRNKVQNM